MRIEANARAARAPRPAPLAADRPFLLRHGSDVASNDSADGPSVPVAFDDRARCHFSVFRADCVSVTSTRIVGGDWRWRLSGHDGTVLVEAGGYTSEAHCREAVAILQARAARATSA